MNVSASTATAAASTSDVSSTQVQAKTAKTSETADKSFEDELKTASDTENSEKASDSENQNKVSEEKQNDKESLKTSEELSNDLQNDDIISSELYTGAVNFTDYKYQNQSQSILTQNIQNLLNTKDLMSASGFDYDVVNIVRAVHGAGASARAGLAGGAGQD